MYKIVIFKQEEWSYISFFFTRIILGASICVRLNIENGPFSWREWFVPLYTTLFVCVLCSLMSSRKKRSCNQSLFRVSVQGEDWSWEDVGGGIRWWLT